MEDTKGGVALSQENQSCLRFSLEESLWFRKGQEVEELISISLDPDITIQENDQYVTIRGSLELTGEYKSYEANVVSEGKGLPLRNLLRGWRNARKMEAVNFHIDSPLILRFRIIGFKAFMISTSS
ncbi:hypothetical protein [Neobacillus sp. 19]|uniref:hypothetical protein n=1 Tax=Neobacillus sp. 19 TaxID=3394458 RepID=UPI003BF62687